MEEPMDPPEPCGPTPFADVGWMTFAVVALLAMVAQVLAFVVVLITGPRGLNLVLVAGGIPMGW